MSAIDHINFRLTPGIVWNLGSLAFAGVAGLALNVIVGAFYGAGPLGILHQVLAIYLVVSQLAAGGLYFSVLSHLPMQVTDRPQCRAIVSSALVLTCLIAAIVSIAIYLLSSPIGTLFNSPDVATGLQWVAPGLFFFSLNKVLLFAFNGMGWLRTYAVCGAARFGLFLVFLGIHTVTSAPAATLAVIFAATEFVLFLPLAVMWGVRVGYLPGASSYRNWTREHLRFSPPAMLNGLLTELYLKIDIVVLGLFVGDGTIGLYAFAANIAEGLAQIPIVLQTVLNPLLSPIARSKDQTALDLLSRKIMIRAPIGLAVISIILLISFVPLATLLTGDPSFGTAWPVLAILCLGVTVSSGHMPFALLLNQAARPGAYLAFMISIVGASLVLHAAAVPMLGAVGAAMAVAGSMIITVPLLRLFIRKKIGLLLRVGSV